MKLEVTSTLAERITNIIEMIMDLENILRS